MARRKLLKNIAAGLHGTFISRNNDIDGYWAMGKLRALAQRHAVDRVHIDLLGQTMRPAHTAWNPMLESYAGYLHSRLSTAAIPVSALTMAEITIDFSAKAAGAALWQHSPGKPFTLTVTLAAHGQRFDISGYGHCEPYDPPASGAFARFVRSTRVDPSVGQAPSLAVNR